MKFRITISLLMIVLAGSVIAAGPAKPKPQTAGKEPFTYSNVVSFFKSAHLHPTEVQKRCTIFFEGEWKEANIYKLLRDHGREFG